VKSNRLASVDLFIVRATNGGVRLTLARAREGLSLSRPTLRVSNWQQRDADCTQDPAYISGRGQRGKRSLRGRHGDLAS